jgi:hypothetical protein
MACAVQPLSCPIRFLCIHRYAPGVRKGGTSLPASAQVVGCCFSCTAANLLHSAEHQTFAANQQASITAAANQQQTQ